MTLVAELTPVQLLFLGAMMITCWILLSRSHRYFRQQSRQPAPPVETYGRRERSSESPAHHDLPGEAARWQVEMHEIAREWSARLDNKMSALQHLVHEADRAAARLEAAASALASRGGASQSPAAKASCVFTPDVSAREQFAARPSNQAEGLKMAREDEASLAASSDSQRDASRASSAGGPGVDRRYEEIYLLADYGHTAAEIAQRVSSPIGEIELILSLRSKR